jgi:hypothetical protein
MVNSSKAVTATGEWVAVSDRLQPTAHPTWCSQRASFQSLKKRDFLLGFPRPTWSGQPSASDVFQNVSPKTSPKGLN